MKKNTLLIVDPSDLTKKYARKMEGLAEVRDGSEKRIGWGYWLNVIVGAEVGSSEIVPLVHELYSQKAEDFVSENHQILTAASNVRQAAVGKPLTSLNSVLCRFACPSIRTGNFGWLWFRALAKNH